ncbi:hypothetical protein K0T92_18570 [Paenibacillus oenotherae]|uniref:Glycosyl transferase family 28 C-terminal domain-containing protein n=1 Tax=Paenibacillus oenotherae TaxID=1435645 RepID=A0ABS7DA29_9BACL|nr:glycosyltransferase [Paenibacillus oenotherae]MBW7476726.1 hypothetical protein [Paenibacillus oenotherae]
MTVIAYYVSDYGYGHASRAVAITRELLKLQPGCTVIFCSSFPLGLLRDSFAGERQGDIRFRYVVNDIGYVLKEDSTEPDPERLADCCRSYVSGMGQRVEDECRFLSDESVALILSDISPVAFVAGSRLGITSIGISNFTWYTAYEEWLGKEELSWLYDAYRQMDYYFALSGASEEPQWGRRGSLSFDFFCREPDEHKTEQIVRQVNPCGERSVVFFGLGMTMNREQLQSWRFWEQDNIVFLVSHNMPVKRSNIVHIPACETESQHYIAASDLIITKAGWGTVGEAVCLGKPLLLLYRRQFKEDRATVRAASGRVRMSFVLEERLKAMTTELEDYLVPSPGGGKPGGKAGSGAAEEIASAICTIQWGRE